MAKRSTSLAVLYVEHYQVTKKYLAHINDFGFNEETHKIEAELRELGKYIDKVAQIKELVKQVKSAEDDSLLG